MDRPTRKQVLVSGLINLETTLRVDAFPLTYEPVRYPFFGVNSTISGVGLNIAKALTKLGEDIIFLSIIGDDLAGTMARQTLAVAGIDDRHVLAAMPQTAQSVIIYDADGRRQIHTDLKDIQTRSYPAEQFTAVLQQSRMAVLCNINYNRPFLAQAVEAGVPVATDVHTIASIDDPYNQDFMAAAHILFLSDEKLPVEPERFAVELQQRYGTPFIVIGLGGAGALLAARDQNLLVRVPAVQIRPIVSTIGAGDALFSSFLHAHLRGRDPLEALRLATLFASYKIGAAGAAEGFLTADELAQLSTAHKS